MQLAIVEPQTAFDARQVCPPADFGEYTEADPHIFSLLRGGPMPLMTLLNRVARLVPSRSKKQRVAIKRQVLRRFGRLLNDGRLVRINRKFLVLPYRRCGSSVACDALRGSTVTSSVP
jgi:hypothetical protein